MAENRSTPASDQPGEASEAQARIPEQPAGEPAPAQSVDRGATDQPPSEQATPPRKRAPKTTKATTKAAKKAVKKAAAPVAGAAKDKTAEKLEKPSKRTSAERAPTKRTPAKEVAHTTARAASGPAMQADPAPTETAVRAIAKQSAVPAVPPGAWASAAWEAVRHLDQPPEQLAELAVSELGPRAAAWAAWLRETYPGAPPAGLARLAARQAGRLGFGLIALEAGGPLTAPVQLAATGWVRATLVLRIAAAHGHDPTDQRRAPELLELLKIGDAQESEADGTGLPIGRIGLALSVLRRVRRGRRTPFSTAVRLLLTASEQSDSLDQLAHRAIRRYRTR